MWLHGGKFVSGSNIECGLYDGTRFARDHGLVVVSLNYRFGAFGMSLPDGIKNISMRDQIAGLQWVQNEITKLGGDKDNVTLAGQSAGGIAVLNLLASPKTKGLFHKAIICSAGAWAHTTEQVQQVNELARQTLDVESLTAEVVKVATEEQMIAMTDKADNAISKGVPGWSPVRDGEYVHTDGPIVALAQGAGDKRPLIIGNNTDEMGILAVMMGNFMGGRLVQAQSMHTQALLLLDGAQHSSADRYVDKDITDSAEALVAAVSDDLEAAGVDEPSANAVGESIMTLLLNDAMSYCTALAHTRGGGVVYAYEFAVPPPVHFPRCVHGMELWHTWGALQGSHAEFYAAWLGYELPVEKRALRTSDEWQCSLASLAKSGKPSDMGGTQWKTFPNKMIIKLEECTCEDMVQMTPGLQHLKEVGAVP